MVLAARPKVEQIASAPPERAAGTGTLVAYVVATFLGATLLFLIEPMVTKMLLPLLGGTAAVWNTAMVFFQAALLGGYAFAHFSLRALGTRRQPPVQLVFLLLPVALLPVAVPAGWHPPVDASPAVWTLVALTVMVGAPFFMLSTAGPTLQRWFSATTHPRAADPYFLYAAGNVGSLLALIGYPLLLEPALSLTDQSRLWAGLYVLFVVASAVCALLLRRHRLANAAPGLDVDSDLDPDGDPDTGLGAGDGSGPAHGPVLDDAGGPDGAARAATSTTSTRSSQPAPAPRISGRTRLRWIYLAAIPSALMLGVTRHIGTDVASMPLLWVIPLSLYLITFIVAFGRRSDGPVRFSSRALKLLVVPLVLTFYGLVGSLWLSLGLHLAVFFFAAMVAHGRLAAERPQPERLTEFYLLLSVGGVVGGIATALIAPLVFTSVLEYPLAIVLALTVLPASAFASSRRRGAPDDGQDDDALATPTVEPSVWRPEGEGAAQPVTYADTASEPIFHRLTWPPDSRSVLLAASVVVLAIASVMVRSGGSQEGLTLSILIAAVAAGAAYALARTALGFAAALATLLVAALLVPANPTRFAERTFFGVHRVYDDKTNNSRHVLLNGTTVHGMEDFVGPQQGRPTTYYHPTGPIGQYFQQFDRDARPHKIGLVGLGSGALAAYGRAGDELSYYEIDSSVIDIAQNRDLFTFVPDSKADVDFKLGDGRLELEAASDARYDLLVVDAFSGDAIPVHLITNEAMNLYTRRLAPHGAIAFHISNRYFDFAPILARLAREQGLVGYIQDDPATEEEAAQGKLEATWVVLAREPADVAGVASDPRWQPLGSGSEAPLWTDQYSDLLHVFRWQG